MSGAPGAEHHDRTGALDTTPAIADAPTAHELTPSTLQAVATPGAPAVGIVPGSLIGGRFRIVAALGRGGMGEIYRADDLWLDQVVALKFVTPGHAANRSQIERLVREVRLARQIAHPNVCRVYDFVDTGREQFVAMEYVDGESLSALLRRLERLPAAKALDLAHQIARALAAVHERGILHRDLKPDNVMVDGRGQARLVDFGIASLSAHPEHAEERGMVMGTLAYMAPEQILGGAPSSRSDVYALGILLYQLFTGRHPFIAETREELTRLQLESPPAPPSSLVPDLDREVERVILWCLDKDPSGRPATARAVAAALPGGDPLTVALAAGTVLDREVVAAADVSGTLSRPWAWGTLAAALLSIAAFVALTPQTSLLTRLRGILPPEALAARARAILTERGWDARDGTVRQGYTTDWGFFHEIARQDHSPRRWEALAQGPSPLVFFWRFTGADAVAEAGGATRNASLVLDHTGRLIELSAAPPLAPPSRVGPGPEPLPRDARWGPFFALAGLDAARFEAVVPRLTLPLATDRHVAWEGPFPDGSGRRVHVEAASFGGGTTFFKVLDSRAVDAAASTSYSRRMRLGYRLNAAFVLLACVPAVWLALRNLRRGRGDREGARSLGFTFLGLGFVASVLGDEPLVRIDRLTLNAPGVGTALLLGALAFVLYLAAEPYVRRRWPHALVAWSRLLSGRWNDALVGRDVLYGVTVGAFVCLLLSIIRLPAFGVVMPPLAPFVPGSGALMSTPTLVAVIIEHVMESVAFGLVVPVAIVVVSAIVRHERLAVGLVLLGAVLPHSILGFHHPVPFLLVHLPIFYLPTRLLRRTGILAVIVFYFVYSLFVGLAGSCDPATWLGRQGLVPIALAVLLALWGFWRSLGAQPLPSRLPTTQ